MDVDSTTLGALRAHKVTQDVERQELGDEWDLLRSSGQKAAKTVAAAVPRTVRRGHQPG